MHHLHRQTTLQTAQTQERADQNASIEKWIRCLNILLVQYELATNVVDVRVRWQIDLGQASYSWSHAESIQVAGNALCQIFDEAGTLRSWTNQCHFAAQDVEQLWQLV